MRREILLAEDDDSLRLAVSRKLTKEGYDVYCAGTRREAAKICRDHKVPLIICDIGLPDGSGLDFCMEIRKSSNVVFLFLTAMDTEADMINGYEAGADDYITKPFSLAVLVSKVNAIMQRYAGERQESILVSGPVTVYLEEGRIKKDGEYLNLTANEQKLLLYFMENPMKILSKNRLLEAIWDKDGNFVDDNTLAVNIRRLREKIEEDPSKPCIIKNVRGLGYIWERICERK